MASQILPVHCPAPVTLADGRIVNCNRRGRKDFGSLCPTHRAEAAKAVRS